MGLTSYHSQDPLGPSQGTSGLDTTSQETHPPTDPVGGVRPLLLPSGSPVDMKFPNEVVLYTPTVPSGLPLFTYDFPSLDFSDEFSRRTTSFPRDPSSPTPRLPTPVVLSLSVLLPTSPVTGESLTPSLTRDTSRGFLGIYLRHFRVYGQDCPSERRGGRFQFFLTITEVTTF